MSVNPEIADNGAEHGANPLAVQLAVDLVELADRYDSLDHQTGEPGGSELQSYCRSVRLLAKSITQVEFEPENQTESPETIS